LERVRDSDIVCDSVIAFVGEHVGWTAESIHQERDFQLWVEQRGLGGVVDDISYAIVPNPEVTTRFTNKGVVSLFVGPLLALRATHVFLDYIHSQPPPYERGEFRRTEA
jgi:hypothetical protein